MMRWPCACLLVLAAFHGGLLADQAIVAAPASAPNDKAGMAGAIVRTHDGGPVRFASVSVESADGTVRRTITADSMGRFAVDGLAPGRYSVRAGASGYVTSVWRPAGTGRGQGYITLVAYQQRDGLVIALDRGGVLTGRVVDSDGVPVEGVPVHALAAEFRNGRALLRQTAARPRITDDRGYFRLFGLEPADYYVAAIPGPFGDLTGGGLIKHPLTYYPGTASASEAKPQTVAADREFDLGDLVVRPAPTTTITGMVVDSRGAPVASGELVLLPADGPVSSVLPRATSDRAGGFAFMNVPEGQYLLQNLPAPSTPAEFGTTTVTVPGSTLHVLRLQAGATRQGKLVFADGAPDFEPRQAVVVMHAAARARSPMSRGARARVRADWTLELTNVWGPHFVRLPEPPPGWMLRHVYVGTEDFIARPIAFTQQDAAPVTMVLTSRGATIAGTVRDDDRRPAAGSTVLIYSADAGHWLPDDRSVQRTQSDAAGHYRSRGLPAGEYLVVAVEDWTVRDWPPRAALLESLRPLSTSISVSEGRQHTQDLSLTGAPR